MPLPGRRFTPTFLLLFLCAGCTIPSFKHPLVDPSDAKPVRKLFGVYRTTDCPDNFVIYQHVGPAGEGYPQGFLRIVTVSQPRDSTSSLSSDTKIGFVNKVGRYYILHLPVSKDSKRDDIQKKWARKWDPKGADGYILLRLSVRREYVEMSTLNNEFMENQINSKKLKGSVKTKIVEHEDGIAEIGKTTITITAETAELRQFFNRNVDGKLFDEPNWKYKRIE